ncbi:hypothetical protein SMICM17S_03285 [Streptomyces microflavus]
MSFAEGCFAGIRNPNSHEDGLPLPEHEALEQLAAFSVLARWVGQRCPRRPLSLARGLSAQQGGDLADGVAGGAADADQGGRGGPVPVAVAEEVQSRFVGGPGAVGGDMAVFATQSQRGEVGEGGAKAGAPDDCCGFRLVSAQCVVRGGRTSAGL